MQFLSPIDMAGNEIQNARFHTLAGAPSSPGMGQTYINSTDKHPYIWNGMAWLDLASLIVGALSGDVTTSGSSNVTAIGEGKVTAVMLAGSIPLGKLATDPLARANHTGTQLANTISDFDTAVRLNRLDQLAAPTSPISMNTQRITNVADPQVATDAVNLQTATALAAGLKDPKDSARLATTDDIALANLQTIDEIPALAGDRVLVKNQAIPSQNGIYTVVDGGPWTRTLDANSDAMVTCGLFLCVEEGTANGGCQFQLGTHNPITLGTTGLTFIKTNNGGVLTPGTGIGIVGNQINVLGGLLDLFGLARTADTFVMGDGTNWVSQTVAQMKAKLGITAGTTKITTNVGDGVLTACPVVHNLNTLDVTVHVYDNNSPKAQVFPDVEHTDVNTITLRFSVAPAANRYRVVII